MNVTPVKVLFVCLGNICRSPLAEGILKHKTKSRKVEDQLEIDSCGTSNYHIGDPPDSRTIANARNNGVVLTHRGRQLTEADLNYFDFILAMDYSNHKNILRLTSDSEVEKKVELLRAYDVLGKNGEVPDPYYGGEERFQEVFNILDRSLDNFLSHLIDIGRIHTLK